MEEQSFNASHELTSWISQNREELGKTVGFLNELQEPKGKVQVMTRVIKNPDLLSESWSKTIQTMKDLKAPNELSSEAEKIATTLNEGINQNSLSKSEQTEITHLLNDLHEAQSKKKIQEIIQQA